MRLDRFDNSDFDRGEARWKEFSWILIQAMLVGTWLPGSGWRVAILRLFGAKIGLSVIVKPSCYVKFPWRLTIGDCSWLGERVWIDNLAMVVIGSHCCISQGAYFCAGSHDWQVETFDLVTKPIVVEDNAWIGAMSRIAPGVTVGEGAVLCLGSVATKNLTAHGIYQGNPAAFVKQRAGQRGTLPF